MNQYFEILVSDNVDMEQPLVELNVGNRSFADISCETDEGPKISFYYGDWKFTLAEFLPFFEEALARSKELHERPSNRSEQEPRNLG